MTLNWGVPIDQYCIYNRLAPPSDWMEEMVMTIYCPLWCLDPFPACFNFHRRVEKRIATSRETGTASVCDLVYIFSVLFEADAAFLTTAITELSNTCPGALQSVLVVLLPNTAHHPNSLQVARAQQVPSQI